jgi:hypothetical protein
MGALDQTFENSVLDACFDRAGASVRLVTAPVKLRYMTANGSSTSGGTQLGTSGGYTAGGQTITTAAASAGVEATNATNTTTNMPATTVVGIEIWDSAGTPKRVWWGALTVSQTTASGDTFSIASGALTASFG